MLKAYRTNRKARDEGLWVPLPGRPEDAPHAEVKVRSEDNPAYRKAIATIVTAGQSFGRFSRRRNELGALSDPVAFDKDHGKAIAKHLLVEWHGFVGHGFTDDGSELVYSPDVAEELLTNENYYDFFCAIVEAVDKVSKMKGEWEEDRKNSSSPDSSTT